MTAIDKTTRALVHPAGGVKPHREPTPLDILHDAARLLDLIGAQSSECRRCADALRKLTRVCEQAVDRLSPRDPPQAKGRR